MLGVGDMAFTMYLSQWVVRIDYIHRLGGKGRTITLPFRGFPIFWKSN